MIVIRLFTHPRTCERGSSLFSAMTRLNLEIKTRASLPSIPSTERTNGDFFPLVMAVLTVLVFLDLLSPGHECYHWFVLVRIRVRVTKLDVNDGVNLMIP